jgi:Domain of unknown function (DUF5671)
MAADERLSRFVERALEKRVSRETLQKELDAAGWRAEEIREALAEFAESDLEIAVPRRRPYLSAKEAFLYLVLFTSLYLWCWHLGSLLFEMIEARFPDAADLSNGQSERTIRWAIAWIVVAFPVFLWLSRTLERGVQKEPAKRASRVRKWLTYMTLYVAATVTLADVATLVFKALGGELSTRLLLKVVTVAVLAGGVFRYYLGELRSEESEHP